MSYSPLKSSTYRNTTHFPANILSARMSRLFAAGLVLVLALAIFPAMPAFAQDWIRTGTGLGVEKVRLAASDFKASSQDAKNAELLKVFNDTLWNDLDNAGIFEMVSKSFYPLQVPANAQEMRIADWANPPTNAAMVAFGSLGAAGSEAVMQGWLYDVKNSSSPQTFGK